MKKSKRLKPVLMIADSQERKATQSLGNCLRTKQSVQNKLSSLIQFRADYSKRFKHTGEQGFGISKFTDYRAFLSKLSGAIKEQEELLKKAEEELLIKQQEWQSASRHSLSMQNLIDSFVVKENKEEEKKEQNENDDRVSQRGRKTLID